MVPLGSTLLPFFVFLLSLSWLSAQLVTVPGQHWWLQQAPSKKEGGPNRSWRLLAIPLALSAFLGIVGAVYNARPRAYEYEPAPPFVQLAPQRAIDLRLNWTAAFAEDDGRALINPSLLLVTEGGEGGEGGDVKLVRSARAHAIGERQQQGVWANGTISVQEIITEWRSDVVLAVGEAPSFDGWDAAAWRLDAAGAPLQLAQLSVGLVGPQAGTWGPLCEVGLPFDPSSPQAVYKSLLLAPSPSHSHLCSDPLPTLTPRRRPCTSPRTIRCCAAS